MSNNRKGGWRIWVARRFEESLLNSGFLKLLKDGSHINAQDSPVRTPLEEPSFYTRTYRVILDGEPVNMIFKLVYNLRDGWADFDFQYRKFPDGRDVTVAEVDRKLRKPVVAKGVSRG